MRWCLCLLAPVLGFSQLRIDHVSIAGGNLDQLRERLGRAGIHAEYGGRHTNGTTEMALVSFPDGSYLELIAPVKNADPAKLAAHPHAPFLQGDGQPAAWAMRAKDFEGELRRLRSAGIAAEPQPRTGRTRPDGVSLEWQTATIGSGADALLFPFLIQDFTPRARRAEPSGHPTTKMFEGIHYIVIAVKNLTEGIERYKKAFASPPPIKQIAPEWGAQLALLGNIPVILAAPVTAESLLNERLSRFGEGPVGVILTRHNKPAHKAASTTRWFGEDVSWLDANDLGWQLGYQ
jgi:hypothetical protein